MLLLHRSKNLIEILKIPHKDLLITSKASDVTNSNEDWQTTDDTTHSQINQSPECNIKYSINNLLDLPSECSEVSV